MKPLPIALTIAGSDSGGGAGIQADLKTFASLGVHGTSAITCITAQNPRAVIGIQACKPDIVRKQIEAVFEELRPAAVKTGMLYSESIMRVVVEMIDHYQPEFVVVDPVMVSTSGASLLKREALRYLDDHLLPRCTLVTPNLDECLLLGAERLKSVEDLREEASVLASRYCAAALVKGGHLPGMKEAVDIFNDRHVELLLTAPFIKGVSTHGTGCTYSAAITAYLALGNPLPQAVALAKEYITQAIARTYRAAKHTVLNTSWQAKKV